MLDFNKLKTTIFIMVGMIILHANPVSAQLVIDQTMGPTQLVRNVLIGSGVTASNISFTGDSTRAICSFSNGNTTELGINDGIIMASGLVTDIPNQASTQASTGLNQAGDADLDNLSGGHSTAKLLVRVLTTF